MNKIMIIGSGGSGKSTLARQLETLLKIPTFHLDQYLWKPHWEMTSKEYQVRVQEALIMKDQWIIDGNFSSTIDMRLEACDTVIFLDFSRYLCLYQALKRVLKYHHKVRPDMQDGCYEKFDFDFFRWIYNYPNKQRISVLQKLEDRVKSKRVIILKNRKELKEFTSNL